MDLYIAPNASFFILKCSTKIISVWGSIRFRPRWESSNYSATSCSNLWSRMGGSTEYIYLVYTAQLKPLLKSGQRLWSGGLFGPSLTCFWKKTILSRLNKHYFEMYQNRWKISRNFLDPLGEKLRFSLQLYLLQNAWFQLSSMNFQNVSGEELTEPPPQTPSPALSLRLRRRFSGALRPRFGLRPQFTPPTCLITPLPTKGY